MTSEQLKNLAPLLTAAIICVAPASAQEPSSRHDELRALLQELKHEQAALSEKIDQVEVLLNGTDQEPLQATETTPTTQASPTPAQIARTPAPENTANETPQQNRLSRLNVSGDLQLRYEGNFSDNDLRTRHRGVLRARLRAEYEVNPMLVIGAELDTGDPDDPNSVHVTLSNFDDDLDVSLSRLYARIDLGGGASILGGKFLNPLSRNDLVWDGDVNPEGVAAIYDFAPSQDLNIRAIGIYSIIDEAPVGQDSDMFGGQLDIAFAPLPDWRFTGAVGFYNYTLANLTGADEGDFRSNLRDGMGGYLSDYDLLDVLASVSYLGLGEHWPLTISSDFVKNYGAVAGKNTGYSAEISLGRALTAHDWQFSYGYSQVGVDAVLGVFSNDNLAIATNYRSHFLGINYAVRDSVVLNATLYHYKPLEALYAGENDPEDWLDRLRLNMTVGF